MNWCPSTLHGRWARGFSCWLSVAGILLASCDSSFPIRCSGPTSLQSDAAYVHRLAVRRQYAGGHVSSTLLSWAVERTRALGRPFLRLDCEASRPRLRAVYERFGFQHHSDLQVGPYFVARYQLAICPLTPDPLY